LPQAGAKETKVLSDDLEACRAEIKQLLAEGADRRRAAEAAGDALHDERKRAQREEAEQGAALAAANTALAAARHENEERRARAAADEAFTSELRRQAEELERSLRECSQQLSESRTREETLKAQVSSPAPALVGAALPRVARVDEPFEPFRRRAASRRPPTNTSSRPTRRRCVRRVLPPRRARAPCSRRPAPANHCRRLKRAPRAGRR